MIIKVVAAALVYKDSVLVAKRQPRSDLGEYRWEFPGGKIEPGESSLQALERELFEELEIQISDSFFKIGSSQTDRYSIELYLAKIQDQSWIVKAHEEVKLVQWKDLKQIPLLVSNQSFVLPLQDWFINQGFK